MEDGHKAEEVFETVTLRSVRTVMDVAARFVRLYDWSSQCREEGLCQREQTARRFRRDSCMPTFACIGRT